MHALGSLQRLQVLRCDSCALDDRALGALAQLQQLTSLTLAWGSLRGEGLGALAGLLRLQELDLGDCRRLCSLRGLELLGPLRQLQLPWFGETPPGELAAAVGALARLTKLSVGACPGRALLLLPELAELHALDVEISAGPLPPGSCSQLTRLELHEVSAQADQLLPLPALRHLLLDGEAGAGLLAGLARQTGLTRLEAHNLCCLAPCALARTLAPLRQLRSLSVSLQGEPAQPAFEAIAGLQHLELLHLDQAAAGGASWQLALLHRCAALRELKLSFAVGPLSAGLLAGLLAKQGMRRLRLENCEGEGVEAEAQMRALAALCGVALEVEEGVF
jgi:hypothetical protein